MDIGILLMEEVASNVNVVWLVLIQFVINLLVSVLVSMEWEDWTVHPVWKPTLTLLLEDAQVLNLYLVLHYRIYY